MSYIILPFLGYLKSVVAGANIFFLGGGGGGGGWGANKLNHTVNVTTYD